MTAALSVALRACAAGLYPDEAGNELLISCSIMAQSSMTHLP